MKYIVYKTVNLVNNRFYIGVHKTTTDEFDGYFGSGVLIQNAIKKYGEENFQRITLFEFDTPEEAFLKESEEVVTIDINPLSYNIAKGGVGYTDLGSRVVSEGIGIHALTFEERSVIQKQVQSNRNPEERRNMCSKGGKIGGAKNRDLGLGVHSLSKEQRSINGKNANNIQREMGVGRFNRNVQSELGKRGGPKNKGFKWYNDGISDLKYTLKEQQETPFELFLEDNPNFSKGRVFRKRSK